MISRGNDANYTITGFNLQHEGTYRCVVSNPDGNSSSNDAMLFRRPSGTDVSAPDSWPFIYQDSFTANEQAYPWGTHEVYTYAGRLKFKNSKLTYETNGTGVSERSDQAWLK